MTLIIENASEKFLPLFQEVARLSKAKISIEEENEEITQAIKAFEKERKEGKTKRYKNIAEFQKAMNA
ncbi:hypothetical protein LS68_008955 [Helicobacter sp. MIT 05-5293]|uniref:Uncharacterized protein n=1 Tax=uncultured Helicobacter sp. TaxID=175537 RepID=A0A650ELL1_9HELI|nr:hypothetical protein [Helicobacter sp. MIT 05-5293]QGT50322.1 hypothetical protein Helico6505_1540 [uncultured Helicobacter sp.]TLD79957.1 hypothetical protein LS68_008955 [Helicobacter sp. MIT 05-5293]